MPVRYYFELNKPINVNNNTIEYFYFDYRGEFIDISIPLIGDSYYRNHYITKNMEDNAFFNSHDERIEIKGTLGNNVTVTTNTINYNIDDIVRMLFMDSIPWLQNKYEKRKSRLILLYLVLLKNDYDENTRMNIYTQFKIYIDDFNRQYKENAQIIIDDINMAHIRLVDMKLVEFLVILSDLSKTLSDNEKPNMVIFLEIVKCYLEADVECLNKHNKTVINYKPMNQIYNNH